MSFKEGHEVQGTVGQCLRELTTVIGHRDFEVTGNQIIVRDQAKRIVIDLVCEGNRHLGSLDLPMRRVGFEFDGYAENETKEFM